MEQKIKRVINIEEIVFDERGEMVVLDSETLRLIAGGAGPAPAPSGNGVTVNAPVPSINVLFCGGTVNLGCTPPAPTPAPTTPPPPAPTPAPVPPP